MDEGVLKALLSLLAIVVYSFFTGMKKKKSQQTASKPVFHERRSAPPIPKIVEKVVAHPKKPVNLTQEVNPLLIPKKSGRKLLRGKSKRDAFILSEVFRNPYLP